MRCSLTHLALLSLLALPLAAQTAKPLQERCSRISGIVADDTGAVIPGAKVTLDGGSSRTSDAEGKYAFACVTPGAHTLHAEMDGFAIIDKPINITATAQLVNITMLVKGEDQVIEATRDPVGLESESVGGAKTLNAKDLSDLADDPDDFKRELQVLASAAGGAPGAATISIDGFQGDSALPPKGSIAFIRINPDLFSSEYGDPPYEGGRIEIYTKPGQSKTHGALFMTYSPTAVNARDPFALSRASIGKQRYGGELSGTLKPNKWDYSLNLEKRDIDNFAVVNAITLGTGGTQVSTVYNVPQSQHLWIGSARSGLQLSKKNLATFAYVANVNNLENVGAGGTTLQEASADQLQSEHALRAVLITTVSPRLVHEARIAVTLRKSDNTPHSFAPSVTVAGAFTSGGSTSGLLRAHENHLEFNDDVLYNRGKHNLKAGIISFTIFQREQIPSNFNGSFYFNSLAAYSAALAGTGTATTYSITTGTPTINLNMSRNALYIQDQYKVTARLQLSAGIRYQFQNDPSVYSVVIPRFGLAWSPDKKQKLVLRARVGMFANPVRTELFTEVLRLNGSRQIPALYYNASLAAPTAGTAILTQRQLAKNISLSTSLQGHLAAEYAFPHGWNVQVNTYPVTNWNGWRTRNINQPLNNSPTGPRPYGANLNILQYQQSSHFRGHVEFVGIDQHSYRKWQAFIGYLHMDFKSTSDGASSSPQNAYSDAGEFGRQTGFNSHRFFLFGSVNLPLKLSLSTNFDASSGSNYNITTGIDNNGDGNFNDRPVYATASTPGAVATRYGYLSSNLASGGAPIVRNLGLLPWMVHLDNNLSRSFKLNPRSNDAKTLTVNVRAANLLNHRNITAVGSILGTPLFDVPYSAETGRRLEAGVRYTF